MQTGPRLAGRIPLERKAVTPRPLPDRQTRTPPAARKLVHRHTAAVRFSSFFFGGGGDGEEIGGKRGKGSGPESCVQLSEGGLRRVKGEFGSAEDGLLARGRRQRRLIHPGRSYGSCHRRGCGDHWPESVQRGNGLGGHRWHSGNGGHSWHSRDGCHRARWRVGILELWVLLQLLVVLCVVPKKNITCTWKCSFAPLRNKNIVSKRYT